MSSINNIVLRTFWFFAQHVRLAFGFVSDGGQDLRLDEEDHCTDNESAEEDEQTVDYVQVHLLHTHNPNTHRQDSS